MIFEFGHLSWSDLEISTQEKLFDIIHNLNKWEYILIKTMKVYKLVILLDQIFPLDKNIDSRITDSRFVALRRMSNNTIRIENYWRSFNTYGGKFYTLNFDL